MRRRWLLVAVILTVTSGCDNVSWGGVEMHMEPPPPKVPTAQEVAAEAEAEAALPQLPEGPVLLAGTRDGDRATLVVVGEVQGDGLAALPTEVQVPGFHDHFTRNMLAPGTELVLFSEGVRVGRMTVDETTSDDRFCAPRAQVSGTVELVPGAGAATRLLALADSAAPRRPFGAYRSLSHDFEQRAASIALGSEAIRQVGASWPESLVESRADIQVLRMPGDQSPTVAATFLVGDRLAVGEPAPGAYSLLVLGAMEAGSYRPAFVAFRPADAEGKGAPRYFGHLDLNGDGTSELVLDVFGSTHRWFASLARRGGIWVQTFQDPCGTQAR